MRNCKLCYLLSLLLVLQKFLHAYIYSVILLSLLLVLQKFLHAYINCYWTCILVLCEQRGIPHHGTTSYAHTNVAYAYGALDNAY